MPGILGVVDPTTTPSARASLAHAMAARLQAQPTLRIEIDPAPLPPALLGRVDLAVFDPVPAPAVSADGACRLVLHGEIADLHGGAAALLDAYLARGPGALRGRSGSFAVAVWDGRARRLLLANDRFGLRNVYYLARDGRFLFAPEVGALLADPRIPRRLDVQAAAEFAVLQFVCGDRTLIRDVRLLPPAALLAFEPGGAPQIETTWRPAFHATAATPRDHVEALADAIRASTTRHTAGPARLALPLSGGLDSRTLLAAVPPAHYPLQTVTYGRAGSDDRSLAVRLAGLAGTTHHVITLPDGYMAAEAHTMVARTDGMHSCLNAHAALLRRAASIADVIVLGNGGDCLLEGLWDGSADAGEEELVTRLFDKLAIGLPESMAAALVAPTGPLADIVDRARTGLRASLALSPGTRPADRADAFNVIHRHRRWVLLGVAAQATHLEFRHPYYDDAVVEVALTIPPGLRAERRAHVEALRLLSPTLAAVRRQGKHFGFDVAVWRADLDRVRGRVRGALRWRANRIGLSRLVARRDRRAFADYNDELRRGSRPLLDLLLEPRSLDRGLWRPDRLRDLVSEHLSGGANHAPALGVAVTLELFARAALDAQEQDRFGLPPLDQVQLRDAFG